MGQNAGCRMEVSQPAPGRVLVETDSAAGVVTTFTATPVDGGQRAYLSIATEWAPKGGLTGLIARLVTPPTARRLYRAEPRQAAAVFQREAATAGGAAERRDVDRRGATNRRGPRPRPARAG